MGIIERIKDAINPKSAMECKREILRELKKRGYRLDLAKRGERARWWNMLVIDGQRYHVVGCQEDEFKVIVADIRSRYNAERIGLFGELASPSFRSVRI
jgi:hypothetical protein